MNTSNNEVLEGEIINPLKDTTQDNEESVKSSKKTNPTFRQVMFANNYKEGNTMGNGTASAIKAGYSEASAASQASQLLKNPKVLSILNESTELAEKTIKSIMLDSDSDAVRLAAAKELLDRTVGKAVQRNESVRINITVESMLGTQDDD